MFQTVEVQSAVFQKRRVAILYSHEREQWSERGQPRFAATPDPGGPPTHVVLATRTVPSGDHVRLRMPLSGRLSCVEVRRATS